MSKQTIQPDILEETATIAYQLKIEAESMDAIATNLRRHILSVPEVQLKAKVMAADLFNLVHRLQVIAETGKPAIDD